jgi:hypothetical protein
MRLAPLAIVPVVLTGLACGGLMGGAEDAATPTAATPKAPPKSPAKAADTATAPRTGAKPAPAAPAKAVPAAAGPTDPKAASRALAESGYTANVYGVCAKYSDCNCNLYDSVQACVDQFGHAGAIFPQQVWSCVLARDCKALCAFDAGTCFQLYAEQLKEGTNKPRDADKCAAGTVPVEVYDLHGDYVRTDCRE